MKKFNKRGFTIVELVIVIAVIGILAGVLIPTFSSITQRAQQTAAMQEATSGRDALLALTNGSMTEDTLFFVGDYDKDTKAHTPKFVFRYSAGAMVAENIETKLPTIEKYDKDNSYYVMYVSDEMIVEKTLEDNSKVKVLDEDYMANLVKIAGLNLEGSTATQATNASGDYYEITVKTGATVNGTIRVYWTSDINPTMIIALGNVQNVTE